MNTNQNSTNYPALYTLITVFFFWGFIAAGNNIFIPFCKSYFSLDQFQSQLVDFAFYTAYYIGALLLFALGNASGKDVVGKWGYKKSIVYGLLFSALGAGAMIVAVEANLYAGMLVGLFIVALGFSLQQTAANPFAILLGDPKTGASRVNLGGGINSLGTTIGPLIVAFALFGSAKTISDDKIKSLGLDKVVLLYVGVGFLFIAAAALFYFSKKVPTGIANEPIEKANKALRTLVVMTILLAVMFTPVFNSYKTEEAKKIETLEYDLSVAKTQKAFNSLKEMTGNEIGAYKAKLEKKQAELTILKKDIEQFRMYWLTGALLVVIGGLYIIFNVEGNYWEGIILALISAFLSASFAVINSKFVKTHEPTLISFYELAGGVLFFSISLLFTNSFSTDFFQLSTSDLIYLFILSSVCTAYAFIASTAVMKYLSPYTVMLTINLEPIYGIILAILIFKDKEKMSPEFYLGALIILFTVVLNGIIKYRLKNRRD